MDQSLFSKDYSKLKLDDSLSFSDFISQADTSKLRDQVVEESKLGIEHLTPKIYRDSKRLKLYSNQRKNPESIGDNSLFSTMNTIQSATYFDKNNTMFVGEESGDNGTAENLNFAFKYDYNKAATYMVDYFWIWNALFHGSAPLEMPSLDRNKLIPEYRLIDPLSFIRDPKAAVVNTFAGIPGLRFWGTIIELTMDDMKKNKSFFNFDETVERNFAGQDFTNLVTEAKRNRDNAQGRNTTAVDLSVNGKIQALDWHTIFNGRLVRCTFIGKDFSRLVRFHYLKNGFGEDETEWRLLNRQFSPISFDWDGVSVPDFVEDKQRARARMFNLALDNIEDTQRQSYLINRDANVDKKALVNYAFNKYVDSDGPLSNAILPIPKKEVNANLVDYMARTMQELQEKAGATPATAQGQAPAGDRTATENQLVAMGSKNRLQMYSSVFGWSEKQRAELWYYLYKNEFKNGIDVKILRIKGVFGTQIRELRRENIIDLVDPDVKVVTMSETQAQKTLNRQNKQAFYAMATQMPNADIKYMIKNIGEDFEIDQQELGMMLPDDPSEYKAKKENIELSKNKTVPVAPEDNDSVEIREHQKATDCNAKYAHIYAHEEQRYLKITHPELFPKLQQIQQQSSAQAPNQNPPDPSAGATSPQVQSKQLSVASQMPVNQVNK